MTAYKVQAKSVGLRGKSSENQKVITSCGVKSIFLIQVRKRLQQKIWNRRDKGEIYNGGSIGGDNVAFCLNVLFLQSFYVCKIADMDPLLCRINLKAAINDLEKGRID